MCSPAMGAVAMGGATGLNIMQQRQQARAQNKYQTRQYNINRDEALRSMVYEIGSVQARVAEERLSASQVLSQLSREAQEALGTIRASTTNVEGASVDATLRDYQRQELIRIGVANEQMKGFESQSIRMMEGLRGQAQSRITAGFQAPVQTPSLLGAAIQIGTSAFQGYMTAGGNN